MLMLMMVIMIITSITMLKITIMKIAVICKSIGNMISSINDAYNVNVICEIHSGIQGNRKNRLLEAGVCL